MKKFNGYWLICILVLVGSLLTGCGGNNQENTSNEAEAVTNETVTTEGQPVEAVGPGEYTIPAQYAAITNPVQADEDSQTKGGSIYAASCERCHGEQGAGDGTSAVQNELEIIDFSNEKIAALSDGELFYIISNGIADTPMEAWNVYNEELRWHLVNYIRTLQQD